MYYFFLKLKLFIYKIDKNKAMSIIQPPSYYQSEMNNYNSRSKKIFIIHSIIVLLFIIYILYIFNNKLSILSSELNDINIIVLELMHSMSNRCQLGSHRTECQWHLVEKDNKHPELLKKFIKERNNGLHKRNHLLNTEMIKEIKGLSARF